MTRRIKRHRKLKAIDRNVTKLLTKTHRYIGNIVISKIVISRFCPIHFTVNVCRDKAYLSLYRGYRYIEDRYIGVPLYKQPSRACKIGYIAVASWERSRLVSVTTWVGINLCCCRSCFSALRRVQLVRSRIQRLWRLSFILALFVASCSWANFPRLLQFSVSSFPSRENPINGRKPYRHTGGVSIITTKRKNLSSHSSVQSLYHRLCLRKHSGNGSAQSNEKACSGYWVPKVWLD